MRGGRGTGEEGNRSNTEEIECFEVNAVSRELVCEKIELHFEKIFQTGSKRILIISTRMEGRKMNRNLHKQRAKNRKIWILEEFFQQPAEYIN